MTCEAPLISISKKTFFPKNVRGLRKIGNNYILITGGIVKIQKCAHKLLHPFNHSKYRD